MCFGSLRDHHREVNKRPNTFNSPFNSLPSPHWLRHTPVLFSRRRARAEHGGPVQDATLPAFYANAATWP
jgi:hypothetical protein